MRVDGDADGVVRVVVVRHMHRHHVRAQLRLRVVANGRARASREYRETDDGDEEA
ncbi:hypothetical protein GCM10009066_25750 [Halarchaeum salinum]|uniref:Uncharacterized protein n=1 Tax=Halarchaeum salinum TaxID=489912 RepID=A0AAV3SAN7_9EURY